MLSAFSGVLIWAVPLTRIHRTGKPKGGLSRRRNPPLHSCPRLMSRLIGTVDDDACLWAFAVTADHAFGSIRPNGPRSRGEPDGKAIGGSTIGAMMETCR